LEKLYLDTTFASKKNPVREFPSKAQGLAELLRKVEAYSSDTVFYFRAWTFGYEDVWIALAAALNTKVTNLKITSWTSCSFCLGTRRSLSDGSISVFDPNPRQ
jgi:hypothetical protein